MTASQKIEQVITNRPSSYVPGHTLERLLGFPPRPDSEIFHLNMAMHYGQGMVAGGIRAVMSFYGIRGPFADFMFTSVRLLIDQSLENWTGVGAPPWYVLLFISRLVLSMLPKNAEAERCELEFSTSDSVGGSGELMDDARNRTWPVSEQVIDIFNKAVYAFTTGYLTDRLIQ